MNENYINLVWYSESDDDMPITLQQCVATMLIDTDNIVSLHYYGKKPKMKHLDYILKSSKDWEENGAKERFKIYNIKPCFWEYSQRYIDIIKDKYIPKDGVERGLESTISNLLRLFVMCADVEGAWYFDLDTILLRRLPNLHKTTFATSYLNFDGDYSFGHNPVVNNGHFYNKSNDYMKLLLEWTKQVIMESEVINHNQIGSNLWNRACIGAVPEKYRASNFDIDYLAPEAFNPNPYFKSKDMEFNIGTSYAIHLFSSASKYTYGGENIPYRIRGILNKSIKNYKLLLEPEKLKITEKDLSWGVR